MKQVNRTFVNKHEVAREFGVSLRTVDKWIHNRTIPYKKLSKRMIRFNLDAVAKALERYTTKEKIK